MRFIVSGFIFACTVVCGFASPVVWVGYSSGPAQEDTSLGTLEQTFGAGPTSGIAISKQSIYLATPGDTSSVITEYNDAADSLSSFTFNPGVAQSGLPGDPSYSPGYIMDMAWGGADTFWLSVLNGMIYHIDDSGQILSSFQAAAYTGIATDGTNLYTTGGTASGNIYQWDMLGNQIQTITTGLNPGEAYGIGYDSTSNSFWVGGTDIVSNVSTTGLVLSQFSSPGLNVGIDTGTPLPEPGTWFLAGSSLLLIGLVRKRQARGLAAVAALCLVPVLRADISMTVSASPGAIQPVGTTIVTTTTASDTNAGTLAYRFAVGPSGGPYTIVRDFNSSNNFEWTQLQEGAYAIQATVRNNATNQTSQSLLPVTLTSRVAGSAAVISTTRNPLVALYSAPPCNTGSRIRVRFQKAGATAWQATPYTNCTGLSNNVYVAGMYATTTYNMRHDILTGPALSSSSIQQFTTGAIPSNLTMPQFLSVMPPSGTNVTAYPFLLFAQLGGAVATDLTGQTVWYYEPLFYENPTQYLYRMLSGSTFLVRMNSKLTPNTIMIREVDLAGNTVREIEQSAISDQLVAAGKPALHALHHDALPLPNGYLALIGDEEQLFTNVQGGTPQSPVDILADDIIVLDKNLQVVWQWRGFDKFSAYLSRTASLNDQWGQPLQYASVANDWMHSNGLEYSPADGNLLLSVRSQDWILKIAYQNGAGDGHIVWRLGMGGDFNQPFSMDPAPWFSHQHFPKLQQGGSTVLSVYDNNNVGHTRGDFIDSRGMELTLDETNMVANRTLTADLGTYAFALGTSQRMANGNYSFETGWVSPSMNGNMTSEVEEVTPTGSVIFRLQSNTHTYRSFRLKDFYSTPLQ